MRLWLCPRGCRCPFSPSSLPPSQAIAHYEQSADYYKSEESNRYQAAPLPLPSPLHSPPATSNLSPLAPTAQPTSAC